MGHGPETLLQVLTVKNLELTLESELLPSKILFYTEGVRLACQGSPALDALRRMESLGVELKLCKNCLDHFGLSDAVQLGIVGGMGDILEASHKAPKVISL